MSLLLFQYPSWLEENEEKIPDDEYKRYSKQYKLVCEICEEFEKEKDEDPDELKRERFEKIMEMMQRVRYSVLLCFQYS